jgi:hypothetical protein
MENNDPQRLRLRAEDAEDLAVLSACLQDALVPVGDIAYLPRERRLAMVVNRYCWECCPEEGQADAHGERVLAAFALDHVRGVKMHGIDRGRPAHLLSLLAMRVIEDGGGGAMVEILFSGGAALRVSVDRLLARVEDVDERYPTSWRPHHPLDDPSPGAS